MKKGNRPNLFGTHAVSAAWLNPDRVIKRFLVTEKALEGFQDTIKDAEKLGIKRPRPDVVERKQLDKVLKDAVHQGIAIEAEPFEDVFVQDFVIKAAVNKERSLYVMLDQVTDPHNVGAILRSACAFGVNGVVMQRRHAPELSGVLAKVATGAVEYVPVAYEINLSRALQTFKDNGFRVLGMDERADDSLHKVKPSDKTVLVLGAEGTGLRPSIREMCDEFVKLPTTGEIQSLNVSNAAAIAFYQLTTL